MNDFSPTRPVPFVQCIAFYLQNVGAIKFGKDPGSSDGRDKPVLSLVEGTCWTKPRSSTDVAAMRIVKWRSGAECGALLAIDREVGEGEIDADRFSVMATAQCGLGARPCGSTTR